MFDSFHSYVINLLYACTVHMSLSRYKHDINRYLSIHIIDIPSPQKERTKERRQTDGDSFHAHTTSYPPCYHFSFTSPHLTLALSPFSDTQTRPQPPGRGTNPTNPTARKQERILGVPQRLRTGTLLVAVFGRISFAWGTRPKGSPVWF